VFWWYGSVIGCVGCKLFYVSDVVSIFLKWVESIIFIYLLLLQLSVF